MSNESIFLDLFNGSSGTYIPIKRYKESKKAKKRWYFFESVSVKPLIPADAASQFDDTLKRLADLPRLAHESTLVFNDIDPEVLKSAKSFIKRVYHVIIKNSLVWQTPHVSIDDNDGISFEWWHNGHALTVFVTPFKNIEYLRAWGSKIWEEMEEGENPSDEQLLTLWQWLYTPKR